MVSCCLLAQSQVGTFTLFQESYHRETFKKMHVSGPKSDFDHRLLTQVCVMQAVQPRRGFHATAHGHQVLTSYLCADVVAVVGPCHACWSR